MNIEDMRKGFEAHAFPGVGKPVDGVTFVGGKYRYSDGRPSYTQDFFAMWCAAIEYAAEMAKPVVIVGENMGGKFGVWLESGSPQLAEFSFKDLAIEWAVAHGYRMVTA